MVLFFRWEACGACGGDGERIEEKIEKRRRRQKERKLRDSSRDSSAEASSSVLFLNLCRK